MDKNGDKSNWTPPGLKSLLRTAEISSAQINFQVHYMLISQQFR